MLRSKRSYERIGEFLNQVGAELGDPGKTDDLTEMQEKYFRIVGELDKNGCNFALILAGLVNAQLEELDELHKERAAKGVN